MDPPKQALTLALALGTLAGGLFRAAQDPGVPEDDRPPHERIDLPSVAACGACHLDVHAEWEESLHHGAWTNTNVQRATRGFEKRSCRPCHSPLPVLLSGLDRPPLYRDFNQNDGVHCLSCHGLEDGVAAARTIPDAPCRPRREPRFLRAELCWPCHEPTHQAFSEYAESDAKALGLRCVDCHMQIRADGSGRSHGPNGGQNAEFVRRGLGWSAELTEGVVRLTLRNRTGHKFPGEIPSRRLLVRVSFDVGEDALVLLRKPNKGEDRADDRLRPDEVRVLRFPLPPGATRAEVRVLFQPLPLLPEAECIPLAVWSSEQRG